MYYNLHANHGFILRNMRLLHTRSLELQPFIFTQAPDYVILSHRWGAKELTFEDVAKDPISKPTSQARKITGFSKVRGACDQAAKDGYDWVWIDSCCIDRSSSADLQEAINSMWSYYARANICYIYLVDVPHRDAGWGQQFQQSEWFTRGWTLQELIAPECVEFYTEDWSPIGTKLERYKEIAEITQIDPEVLVQDRSVETFSAAERLSWAAHRQVTREEDEAYSLWGLFQVNMPMLYGEGRERAFVRLQEAIYKSTTDHTLFLFRYSLHREYQPLLADCPTRFCQRNECTSCKACATQCFPPDTPYTKLAAREIWSLQAHEQIMTTVTTLSNEMSVKPQLIDYRHVSDILVALGEDQPHTGVSHIAVLNYTLEDHAKGALCLLLFRPLNTEGVAFHRIKSCPAIIPRIQDFTTKLQKQKILVCPGPSFFNRDQPVDVTFALGSDPFLVQAWSAKCVNQYSAVQVQESPNTEFRIQTTRVGNAVRLAEISSRAAFSQNHTLQISLRLIQFDETWSIKEVSEVKSRKRQRKQCTRFLSSTICDRCTISLSDGKRVSVGLRRLAASRRSQRDDTISISQIRCQIVLKLL
jgi:hypothetical protein